MQNVIHTTVDNVERDLGYGLGVIWVGRHTVTSEAVVFQAFSTPSLAAACAAKLNCELLEPENGSYQKKLNENREKAALALIEPPCPGLVRAYHAKMAHAANLGWTSQMARMEKWTVEPHTQYMDGRILSLDDDTSDRDMLVWVATRAAQDNDRAHYYQQALALAGFREYEHLMFDPTLVRAYDLGFQASTSSWNSERPADAAKTDEYKSERTIALSALAQLVAEK